MRRALLVVGLAGCVGYRSSPPPSEPVAEILPGDGGSCGAGLGPLPRVDGRSAMVDELRCVPNDPVETEWYGCLVDENECWPTPDRVVAGDDGSIALYLGAQCASRRWHDVRIDDTPVPPNLIVWTTELHLPAGALLGGRAIDLADAPGAEAVFRIRDDIALEEPECCHPPDVTFNGEGDRHAVCRQDWRTFAAGAGGLDGRVLVTELEPSPGGHISLEIDFAGCAEGLTAELDFDGTEAVPGVCCAPFHETRSWDVGEGGVLSPAAASSALGPSHCCAPADLGVSSCL